jgi:hypothetical protein
MNNSLAASFGGNCNHIQNVFVIIIIIIIT